MRITPGWFSSEFPNALLEMTPITIFYKRMSFARYHRERVLYVLNRLPEVAALKSPKFVFVHIVSPHNPFVFGPDGEPVNPRDLNKRIQKLWTTGIDPKRFRRFYRDQVTYLNKRMQGVIEQILARSERPPVIILQGDHGPWSQFDNGKHTDACIKERFAILNAYHLPGDGQTELYPDISPVNSFRIVLNRYFGQDFELLEDRCWFSMADSLYRLREVTDLVRPKTDEKPNPPTSR